MVQEIHGTLNIRSIVVSSISMLKLKWIHLTQAITEVTGAIHITAVMMEMAGIDITPMTEMTWIHLSYMRVWTKIWR